MLQKVPSEVRGSFRRHFRGGVKVITQEAINEDACVAFAKILAEASEQDCFRFMSYIVLRLEYLRGKELKRLAGYHAN
jgi:hypothetical protein